MIDELGEMRLALGPALAEAAVFDGWGEAAVRSAAAVSGVDPAAAVYALGAGEAKLPLAAIAAWIGSIDAGMAAALPAERLAAMKVRERIRALVLFRLEAAVPVKEALRRALAVMAMPQNLAFAAKLGWHSADAMWRLAGDTATDYNHYTKRLTLGALYGSTLAVFADDSSDDFAETRAFLERRIDGVMWFEQAKAKWLAPREHFSPARFLGRLRYPAR